jgi:hypothetical protein
MKRIHDLAGKETWFLKMFKKWIKEMRDDIKTRSIERRVCTSSMYCIEWEDVVCITKSKSEKRLSIERENESKEGKVHGRNNKIFVDESKCLSISLES